MNNFKYFISNHILIDQVPKSVKKLVVNNEDIIAKHSKQNSTFHPNCIKSGKGIIYDL